MLRSLPFFLFNRDVCSSQEPPRAKHHLNFILLFDDRAKAQKAEIWSCKCIKLNSAQLKATERREEEGGQVNGMGSEERNLSDKKN